MSKNFNQNTKEFSTSISVKDLLDVECENCSNKNFKIVYRLKRISPLISGKPRDEYFPIELFVCDKCGHLNKNLNPFNNLEENDSLIK